MITEVDSVEALIETDDRQAKPGHILVVSSGIKGLAVFAHRVAVLAEQRGVPVTLVRERPALVKAKPRRPRRAGVSFVEQLRHRRRWRNTPGSREIGAIASSYSGLFVAGTGPGFAALPGCAGLDIPKALLIDVTMPLHAEQNGWRRHPLFTREVELERSCLAAADLVCSLSSWAQTSVVDDLGIDRARTIVVPPVVWRSDAPVVEQRPNSDDVVRLIAIGSPWIRKGMDRTVAWLRERPDLDVELHLVGDAPPNIEDRRVVAHGRVGSEELLGSLLPRCDLLVHPTRRDQSSTVVVEAAWCGVPAVSTAKGGIPELIEHDDTGWIVADDTERALHEMLDQLVADPVRLAAAGVVARRKAEQEFDAEAHVGPLVDWLSGAAGWPGTVPR